jgi:ribosomal-protein-alanine N-acetyltransferase
MPKPGPSRRAAKANSPRRGAAIRPATAADLDAVAAIEREGFANPWTREYYAAELENDRSHSFVAVAPVGAIVGYLLFWRLGSELELHKIAVAPAQQRQGHGARLMEFFIGLGRGLGCERAVLEVRAGNAAAIGLYEKFGFRRVGRRKDYYERPREDALVFELRF